MTDSPDPLEFTPVGSTSTRHDGWTPDRQRQFIDALSVMGVVARAARAVGKSATGAYALRQRPDAASFIEAWDTALLMGRDRVFALAYDRAVNGYTVPRYYRGKQIGTSHRHDLRMITAALASYLKPRDPSAPQLDTLLDALTDCE
jgi:hypothetical protein